MLTIKYRLYLRKIKKEQETAQKRQQRKAGATMENPAQFLKTGSLED